jgi:hypothetical protein
MFDLKSSLTHNIFIRIQLNIPADSFLGIKRKLESLTFRVSKRCFGTKLLNKQELLPNEAVIHLGDKRAKIVVMRFGPWGCFSDRPSNYRCTGASVHSPGQLRYFLCILMNGEQVA